MHQGLFAFHQDAFYFHHFRADEAPIDHAAWFERLGLPGHGPGYDAILRGRVTLEVDTDRVILGIYGAAYLSNPRFTKVVAAFELDEGQVVERRLSDGR